MLPPIYCDLSYPISDIFACSFTTIPFNSPLLTAAVFTLQEIILILHQTPNSHDLAKISKVDSF